MEPVFQEYDSYSDDGKMKPDCLRACVASLFELHISQVPHFIMYPGDQTWDIFNKFIWSLGYCWKDTCYKDQHDFNDTPSIDGYHIVCVRTGEKPKDTHTIIADSNGLIVHDPFDSEVWKGINILESDKLEWWAQIEKREDHGN